MWTLPQPLWQFSTLLLFRSGQKLRLEVKPNYQMSNNTKHPNCLFKNYEWPNSSLRLSYSFCFLWKVIFLLICSLFLLSPRKASIGWTCLPMSLLRSWGRNFTSPSRTHKASTGWIRSWTVIELNGHYCMMCWRGEKPAVLQIQVLTCGCVTDEGKSHKLHSSVVAHMEKGHEICCDGGI